MRKLIDVAAALAGGALGTFLMQRMLKVAPKLPESLKPPEASGDPGHFMVDKAERLIGRRLPAGAEDALAKSLQWAYGMTFPIALGLLAERIGRRRIGRVLAAGAAMGALTWAVGYLGWLPATGLVRPIHRQKPTRTASALVSHLAYGTVAAVPLALTGRFVA